jgi:O-acetyl-ADP-ribose deacetylase (regulator of RNase III)
MPRPTKLRIRLVDITSLDVDAIVNAANQTLLGGRGVDGAIHEAAGPELLAYCRLLGGAKPGQAKISPGFNLKARHVIHTVGPEWEGGEAGEADILAKSYRNSILLAIKHDLRSLAFPAISTGAFAYPAEPATRIALQTVREVLAEEDHVIEEVTFSLVSESMLALYERIHDEVYAS